MMLSDERMEGEIRRGRERERELTEVEVASLSKTFFSFSPPPLLEITKIACLALLPHFTLFSRPRSFFSAVDNPVQRSLSAFSSTTLRNAVLISTVSFRVVEGCENDLGGGDPGEDEPWD